MNLMWSINRSFCRTFGHRRRYTTVRRMRITRRGFWQMRDCVRVRCSRCELSGDDCYERSHFERLAEWWRDQLRQARESYDPPIRDDSIPF